jgi:hypothetical protein
VVGDMGREQCGQRDVGDQQATHEGYYAGHAPADVSPANMLRL